jgi:hypothetical protein
MKKIKKKQQKVSKKDITVEFSFDQFDIIGVSKDNVWLDGRIYDDSESTECLVFLDKKLLHKALDLWIKDKKAYCDRFNHFCGRMGSIQAKKFVELDRTSDDCRVVKIISIENHCNMEHG